MSGNFIPTGCDECIDRDDVDPFHVCPQIASRHEMVEAVQRVIDKWAGPWYTGEGMTDEECLRRIRTIIEGEARVPDPYTFVVRPACQSEHRPEHWKRGQSPRATRLVVFRDGHREYLCKRCVTQARRTSSTDPREQVERTELPA